MGNIVDGISDGFTSIADGTGLTSIAEGASGAFSDAGDALVGPGGLTDSIGLTNHKGEKEGRENAAAAAAAANKMASENIEFQREQYSDWKAVYGELQDNLGEYFNNLGPERVMTLGLQEQQRAHQKSKQQIRRTMAQRGLGDSKFEAYMQTMSDVGNASERAMIRATAEERSAQQRMSFLGLGLGQGAQMLGQVNSAASIGTNAHSNQANMHSSQFTTFANNNAAMMRQILDTGAEMGGTVVGASDIRIKRNINKVGKINGYSIYTFEFKANPGKLEMGVMAQEVEEITPEAVFEIDGVKHVNYSKLFNIGG